MWTRTVTLVALIVGLAAPASAQIYSWRDENGVLTLSDRPRPGTTTSAPAVRTYSVGTSEAVRVTRPVVSGVGTPFDHLIVEQARHHRIRPDLVRAVIQVESAFNPNARSPKGAQGLMQLMPATARELGVANPYNPEENIRGGVAYLRQLLDRYDNNEALALAAYNAGPGAVDKYGESVPPYRETQNYVTKIGKLAGTHTVADTTRIYETAEVKSDGRVVPKYTDRPQ